MRIVERFTKKQKTFGMIGIVLLILLLIYIGIAVFFNSHFGFRTTINGVKVSGKSVRGVEQLITKEISDYTITLKERDGETEILEGAKIKLKPVFDGSLRKEMNQQKGFAWPIHLFQSSEIKVDTMVTYDEKELETQMKTLSCMDERKMKEPKDAGVSEYSKKSGYKIVPEEKGTKIDYEKFKKVLGDSITNLKKSISLEKGCYIEPKYTKESKEIKNLVGTMNKYVATEITYEFGSNQEKLDGTVISQWLSVNDNAQAEILEKKVSEYIATLAERYNTAGKPKTLKTSYGTTVTVSGGDYGWKIDAAAEKEALMGNINAGEKLSKKPIYAKTASSYEGNDYGNTYVEVNLTAQHLYYYKNGTLILESDFVSGNEAKSWDTPTGAYSLYYKQKDKTLRGEDYATPVSYWMPFNGGVGFHDATWRSDFGGNYYKSSGSHGCVNLPFSIAKKLYENIEAGCPILVYKLAGTESAKGQSQNAAAQVINMIRGIGEVSQESRNAINSARSQYDALDNTAKGYVTNYDVLVAAEARIGELDAQAAANAADEQANNEAQPVIDAINNNLASQEITLDKKAIVQDIRKQYDTLSDIAKSKVSNYSVLEEAERTIAALENR